MISRYEVYSGLPEGLKQLPLPHYLKIKRKRLPIPGDLNEFTKNLCFGQRLFIVRKEEFDFGLIIRNIDGYYYPLYTNKKWDEEEALLFGEKVLTCTVEQLYPITIHFNNLIDKMMEREKSLLHKEPTKIELASGIERFNVFAELQSINFLRDVMKVPVAEVLQTPYNECLVRFMLAKTESEYQERYLQLSRELAERSKSKSKYEKE